MTSAGPDRPIEALATEYVTVAGVAIKTCLDQVPAIVSAHGVLASCLRSGGKLLVCGNGGSAAQAGHFSAELVAKFEVDLTPSAVVSLVADTACLTAIANDYSFERVFARQVAALGRPGDVLLAISTSGRSANIIGAVREAHARRMKVVSLTGADGGTLAPMSDVCLRAPIDRVAHVQECHLLYLHVLCMLLESGSLTTARTEKS